MSDQPALNGNTLQTIIIKAQLDPNLKLTLEDKCLRKVLVCLFNSNNILRMIENCNLSYDSFLRQDRHLLSPWQCSVEAEIKYNVSKLPLPEALKKKVTPFIKPISFAILKWKTYHETFISKGKEFFDKRVLEQLQWTCEGAIDYRKTALALLRLDVFDVETRYRLACLYCLEEDIKLLWQQLSEEKKLHFHGRSHTYRATDLQMEYYWPHVLLGEEFRLPAFNSSFNEHSLMLSIRYGNRTVTEYFFRKLAAGERNFALFTALQAVLYRDGMFVHVLATLQMRNGDNAYLLSLLSPQQLMQLVRKYPFSILNLFQDWPCHEVFLDILDVVWSFLPEGHYGNLKSVLRNAGFYMPYLYQKVFIDGPVLFKTFCVASESRTCKMFDDFFYSHDIETIKVIFDNIDHGDVIAFLSSIGFIGLLDCWVMDGMLDKIRLCFDEASLSEKDKKTLLAAYEKHLGDDVYTTGVLHLKSQWRYIFSFLENALPSKKRISEDEKPAEVKKLCN